MYSKNLTGKKIRNNKSTAHFTEIRQNVKKNVMSGNNE